MVTTTVEDEAAATRLAEELLDGARRRPVLGIAVPDAADATLVDTDALLDLLPGGDVRLLVGPAATWTLKRDLPPGLDVFGRAVRLWWPPAGGLALVEHPLALLDERLHVEGVPLATWLGSHLARGPQQVKAHATYGLEQQAVVLEVDDARAVVRLSDGGSAELPASAFPGAECPATRLVRVAQTLRVRVPPGGPGQTRTVAPVWSTGEARARLEAQCPTGSTVLGRVVSLRNHGALVSLLPGVVGMLNVSEVAPGWIRHAEEHLAIGDVVAVRILDHDHERPALSLLDTAEQPLAPALLPDGPPWLSPEADQPVVWAEAPLATELPAGRDFDDDPAERPHSPSWDGPTWERPAWDEERLLRDAVHQGHEVREELVRVTEAHERHVAGLRAEARQLVRDLERDLADARERVVTTTSGGAGALAGSAEEALATARSEVARLRRELRVLAEEQDAVAARTKAAETRADRAEHLSEEHRRRAELHSHAAASLRSELERYAPESQRLVEAIRTSWVRTTTPSDREQYPWRDPVVGSGFLSSLHRVEGVSIERVYDVCAEVVCGRAQQRHGLAVHPLRATDASGSPQKVREDGARAFRASLQSRTSAARRLHYWLLPDGRVELARIGYHDDFTI